MKGSFLHSTWMKEPIIHVRQAFISWRVKFHYSDGTGSGAPPGVIAILDDIGGGTLAFVLTGVYWNQGYYTELKVQFDPALGEIRWLVTPAVAR